MTDVMRLLLVGLVLATIGCEATVDKPEQPTPYDKNIDGPPTYLNLRADVNLLGDQGKFARQSATPVTPSAAAPGDEVQAVRRAVAALAAAVKADNTDQVVAAFAPADAAVLGRFRTARSSARSALRALEQLVATKVGAAAAGKVKANLDKASIAGLFGAGFADVAPAQLKITPVGQNVQVTRPGGPRLVFVRVGGSWKLRLTPAGREVVGVMTEVCPAIQQAAAELTDGLNNGTITQANFDAQLQQIGRKHLQGVVGRLMSAKAKLLSEAGGPGPAPGTVPPGAGAL